MNNSQNNTGLSKRQLLAGTVFTMISASAFSNPQTPLTRRQNAIIWGNILGDGHLQLSPYGKTVRLTFSHSSKQAEYVKWQFRELKWLCEGISEPTIVSEGTEKQYLKCRAYTRYLTQLKPFHDLTYVPSTKPKRRFEKIVPSNLSNYLKDPEMLMVWYLDDGTLRRDGGACRLATQGFTLEENEILQNCLKQNFDITTVIEKWPKQKTGLYVPARQAPDFVHLFSSTVVREIPSMTYKLSLYL